jgi:hypothetical protein
MGDQIETEIVEFLDANDHIPPETVLGVVELFIQRNSEEIHWSSIFDTITPYGKGDPADAMIPSLGHHRVNMTNSILEKLVSVDLVSVETTDQLPKNDKTYTATDLLLSEEELCTSVLENYEREEYGK